MTIKSGRSASMIRTNLGSRQPRAQVRMSVRCANLRGELNGAKNVVTSDLDPVWFDPKGVDAQIQPKRKEGRRKGIAASEPKPRLKPDLHTLSTVTPQLRQE